MAKKENMVTLVEKLQAPKPKDRIKACEGLAKLEALEAIPYLVKTYQEDEDEQVRLAAENTLRQFKALEPTTAVAPPALKMLMYALGGLFVLLLVANAFVMFTGGEETPSPTPIPVATTREELVDILANSVAELDSSARVIKEEMGKVGNGEADCRRTVTRPSAIKLTELEKYKYPDIALFVAELYTKPFDDFASVYDNWKDNCRDGRYRDVGVLLEDTDKVTAVLDRVGVMRRGEGEVAGLETITFNPAPTRDPSEFGKPTATPVPPTQTPTPLPNIDYALHVTPMLTLVNDTLTALTSVEALWKEAQSGATVGNCRTPSVGDPYIIPEDQKGDANLDISAQQISQALADVKDNFTTFGNECTSNNLRPIADERLNQLANARAMLEDSKIRLESIPLN